MKLEDATAQVVRVDAAFRRGTPIAEEDKKLVLTRLYNDCDWGGPAATPLPPPALKALGLEDLTGDARFAAYFGKSRRDLGIYRTIAGCYWLLSHDPLAGAHTLTQVGTAGDALARFGAA